MKNHLAVVLLALPFLGQTQSDTSRWTISPEIIMGSSMQGRDTISNTWGYFSWSTGLKCTYGLKKGALSSGLYYSSRAQRIENRTFGSNLDLSTGDYDTTFGVIDEMQFLEIPFTYMMVAPLKGKWTCYGDWGLGLSFIVRERQRWTATPLGGKGIANYRKTSNSAFVTGGKLIVHSGVAYPLNPKTDLVFMLNMDFYFLPSGYKMMTNQPLTIMEGGISIRRRL